MIVCVYVEYVKKIIIISFSKAIKIFMKWKIFTPKNISVIDFFFHSNAPVKVSGSD